MIEIEELQRRCSMGHIVMTIHANEKMRTRGITPNDIIAGILTGEIIEQYPESYPFPSCLICGNSDANGIIHIVAAIKGKDDIIITAYWPDRERLEKGYKERKK